MLKSKTLQKGFTIVELLIVIVVIGILAALVLNTFSGVQKRARDTERQTDINSLATQLEVYYNDGVGYPLIGSINSTVLKGLDGGAIVAPGQGPASSMTATATPTKDQYGYQTFDTAGVACNAAPCAKFVLTYFSENEKVAGSEVKTKKSLND